jgi:HB1, ASXL, restriction endonuclease HTH domain
MTCQEMIEQMAARGYWTSPKGRTPAATVYSAMLREIAAKGKEARFVKAERGKFARNRVV